MSFSTATNLVGLSVLSAEGERLGRVKGVESREGLGSAFLVISLGSFLRMGEECRAVPLTFLEDDPAEGTASRDCCRLRLSTAMIREAPIVTSRCSWDDVAWCRRLARHFDE